MKYLFTIEDVPNRLLNTLITKIMSKMGIKNYSRAIGRILSKNWKIVRFQENVSVLEEIIDQNVFVIKDCNFGDINALVNTLMEQMCIDNPSEAVSSFISGGWDIIGKWKEKDEKVLFGVVLEESFDWSLRFHKKGLFLSNDVERVIVENLIPTYKQYNVVILRKSFFSSFDFEDICIEAEKMGLAKPPIEVAPLIREFLTDKEMNELGFGEIKVMHNPIKVRNSLGVLCIFSDRDSSGDMLTFRKNSGFCQDDTGYAFIMKEDVE